MNLQKMNLQKMNRQKMNRQCVALVIVLLLTPGGVLAEEMSGCTYLPRATEENPQPEFEFFEQCLATTKEGEMRLQPFHLAAMDFGGENLAVFSTAGHFYYVKPDGLHRMVLTYDNWADDFAQGLARTQINGKVAYIDTDLRVVIPPVYDWGWPFEEGLALVCRGCRLDGEPGDEHRTLVGGKWGYIDAAGQEMVAVVHSREEARALREKLPSPSAAVQP